jgi:hypothetical protein
VVICLRKLALMELPSSLGVFETGLDYLILDLYLKLSIWLLEPKYVRD